MTIPKQTDGKTRKKASIAKHYLVNKKDLPLSCPTSSMESWNTHPKVYLPIEETGESICPYCSARYIMNDKNDEERV